MKVSEIFYSIEGEGSRTGVPSVFVRLHGCNLRCSYCDSMYAVEGDDYKEMSISQILNEVDKYSPKYVTLTGGEPMAQKDSLELLRQLSKRYQVNLETNGAINLKQLDSLIFRDNIVVTLDLKSKSSNMSQRMDLSNLGYLRKYDSVKLVTKSIEDIEEYAAIFDEDRKFEVYISPIFGEADVPKLVDDMIHHPVFKDARFQLQIHKFIWDPEMRGV